MLHTGNADFLSNVAARRRVNNANSPRVIHITRKRASGHRVTPVLHVDYVRPYVDGYEEITVDGARTTLLRSDQLTAHICTKVQTSRSKYRL